jgi:hypothetical protein
MTREHVILCQITQISNKLLPELGMLGMIQLYKSRECSLPLITTTTTKKRGLLLLGWVPFQPFFYCYFLKISRNNQTTPFFHDKGLIPLCIK